MLSLSLLLIECKKTGKKKGHGMIWRFSTGFCNFARYKILCCTAAPMQKNCSGVGGEYEFCMT